jgi:hypothetical protein
MNCDITEAVARGRIQTIRKGENVPFKLEDFIKNYREHRLDCEKTVCTEKFIEFVMDDVSEQDRPFLNVGRVVSNYNGYVIDLEGYKRWVSFWIVEPEEKARYK